MKASVWMYLYAATAAAQGPATIGAPYSAEAVTETTQTLADGNRIRRKSTEMVYRDSEGRTRREHALDPVGPWPPDKAPRQIVMISDPVAKVHYTLEPANKKARKMPFPSMSAAGVRAGHLEGVVSYSAAVAAPPGGAGSNVVFERSIRSFPQESPPQGKTESLGKRMFDGVEAEGTRTTLTIPAGKIGNERPIEIVSERWFSQELQTVVYSKRNDPRFGETVYRLTGINRTEPLPLLFQVPPDYTVQEAPRMMLPHRAEEVK